MFTGMRRSGYQCGGQRIIFWNQFSPSSMWVIRFGGRHPDLSHLLCLLLSLSPPSLPLLFLCFETTSSVSPGWPQTCNVSKAGLVPLASSLHISRAGNGHHYLLWGHFFQTQACLGQGRGGEGRQRWGPRARPPPAPAARGAARRMQHTAAFMGRRQRAASLTLRGKFAGGRRGGVARQVEAGEERAAVDRVASPGSAGSRSVTAADPDFFLPFLAIGDSPGWPLTGCVAENNLEIPILQSPPPTYVYR